LIRTIRAEPGQQNQHGLDGDLRYHDSADDVPDGLRLPHWSWDGLVREEPSG
jgi:hypothetical protein